MIRTRDLFVFIATLFALLVGIALTLSSDILKMSQDVATFFAPREESVEFTAEAPQEEINREDIISRLRNALALHESSIEPQPSVEEDAVEETEIMSEVSTSIGVERCAGGDDAVAYAKSWPLAGVSVQQNGTLRTVVHEETNIGLTSSSAASSTGSSTAASVNTVLLTLPVSPYASAEPHCVPSDIIGVTTSGSLMFNNDAAFYRGYGSEYLIGYARDGYPIYGYYEGVLDNCGGYMHAQGYRYSVSATKDHLLSCFTAAPASFSGL